MSEVFKNYIDGKWLPAQTGQVTENRNPANRNDLVGLFPASDQNDVGTAVAAAKKAFASWRLVPAPKRGELLYRVGELLRAHKEEIARIMTREMGKVLKETRGDVQEGIDTAFYVAGEGRRLFGETTPSELPDKFAMSVRAPVGVCALITPWNFPMAIPTWKMFPALICGNTVVLKGSELCPATHGLIIEALQKFHHYYGDDFRVEGELVGYTTGPTVTQYEIEPAPGVKVRQIANLANDLALAMRAPKL